MDTNAIIDNLTTSDGLPREALAAAAERRQEMAPLFIAAIEAYLSDDDNAELPKDEALFLMFHLLGDWRETAAYPALARFLRLPGDDIHDVLGDAVVSTSHRVMASVFDGDPQPIYDIILDASADEYIRAQMCETLAMLVWEGKLDRDAAAGFLQDCFTRLEPREECFVWNGWQRAIAMLGLKDLAPLVQKAFEEGRVDESWLGHDEFLEDLEKGVASPDGGAWKGDEEYELFGDTVEELSQWWGFSEEAERQAREGFMDDDDVLDGGDVLDEPATNPYRNVGRNDPCPCGSGKKFKKCCLE